jgi:Tol biopolymer transport system component
MRPDGTGRRLFATGSVTAYWPTWSPNGRRIAFSTKSEPARSTIYAVDVDGTHRKLVTRRGAAPDWSPDGTTIAYWASACTGLRNQDGRTRLVTPNGRDVTPNARPGRCGGIGPRYAHPAWSPDGSRLAVTSWNGLYVMNADGSHVRAIIGTDGFGDARPTWQPHQ